MSPLTKSLESIATALQVRHRELVLTRNRSERAEIKNQVPFARLTQPLGGR